MNFINPQLFLGFPIGQDYAAKLKSANPHIIALFVQNSGDYLQEVTFKNGKYWGKFVGNIADFSELELIETNIISILKKFVPDYPYDQVPLVLFTIPGNAG